jgi:hypothetical protein
MAAAQRALGPSDIPAWTLSEIDQCRELQSCLHRAGEEKRLTKPGIELAPALLGHSGRLCRNRIRAARLRVVVGVELCRAERLGAVVAQPAPGDADADEDDVGVLGALGPVRVLRDVGV